MLFESGIRGIACVVVVTGLVKGTVACGEEFTCADDRSCPSASPDSGNTGGSAAVGGRGGGSAGAAGSMGTGGSPDSAGGQSGQTGDSGGSDADASDAPTCESEMPNTAVGVFVSTTGQDDSEGSTCGKRETPCKTIAKALSVATTDRIVYLAAGTYEEDGLALKAGVTLQGGWDHNASGGWSRLCTPDRKSAVIVRAKNADRTLSAVDLGGKATLDTLTIRSKTAVAAAGQSSYGVFATGTSTEIVLNEVAIEIGPAGAGGPGMAGPDGAAPVTACSAGTSADGATAGAAGAGAPVGPFSITGYFATPGVGGGIGANGSNGTAAAAPACITCPNPGAVCQQGCIPNPQGCLIACLWTSGASNCGIAGTNGCAGGGGQGGLPGAGGGSSVAVFLWNATLRASSGKISSGKGGDGGLGGPGGRGKVGSAGAPGRAGETCGVCSGVPSLGPCTSVSQTPAAGEPGGTGGVGKDGGPAGGGSGGPSYAVYKGGSAVADVAASVEVVAGSPGTGAGTGMGRGADGSSKPIGP